MDLTFEKPKSLNIQYRATRIFLFIVFAQKYLDEMDCSIDNLFL
jgi:hypothetical protein